IGTRLGPVISQQISKHSQTTESGNGREEKIKAPRTEALTIRTMELVAAASAATTVLTATTTATAALFARPGEIDRDGASANRFAIHPIYGLLRLLGRAHSDETEPARTARRAVHHQVRFSDRAVGGKRILQIVFRRLKRKVPDEQFSTHCDVYCPD